MTRNARELRDLMVEVVEMELLWQGAMDALRPASEDKMDLDAASSLSRRLSSSEPRLSTESSGNDEILNALLAESNAQEPSSAPPFARNNPFERKLSVASLDSPNLISKASSASAGLDWKMSSQSRTYSQSPSISEGLAEATRGLLAPGDEYHKPFLTGSFVWARQLFLKPMASTKEDVYRCLAMERPF